MLQVSYEPLWETLSARDMKKVDLKTIISPTALKKLQNHELVSLNVPMRLCEVPDVPVEKVVVFRHI